MHSTNKPQEHAMLVSARELGKQFSGTWVLQDLTVALHAGELVGMLGPNGAGKTTTLKLLLGLLRPSAGAANILGFDCVRDSLQVKQLVGYVPDEPHFYDFLTGRETLDFVVDSRGLDRRETKAFIDELAERFQFVAQLDALTATYSHGMKKKLALLCAYAHRPDVLLLDEPTNGLDPTSATQLRGLLEAHAERGGCALISTHMLDLAESMCDQLIVIERGRILGKGSVSEVKIQSGLDASAPFELALARLLGAQRIDP
jgi:ABC-2 type transport system ATP-binding protein